MDDSNLTPHCDLPTGLRRGFASFPGERGVYMWEPIGSDYWFSQMSRWAAYWLTPGASAMTRDLERPASRRAHSLCLHGVRCVSP